MIMRPVKTICQNIGIHDELIVRIQFKNPKELEEDQLVQLKFFFQTLAEMAGWGGLSGNSIEPTSSSLHLKRHGRIEPDIYEWHYDQVLIDVRSLFLIQNMVHNFHLYETPISALHIFSPMIKDSSNVPQELPFYYQPQPFELIYEIEALQVCVEIDFLERQYDEAKRTPFLQAWNVWLSIAAFGAFCDSDCFSEEKKAFLISEPPQSSSTGITFFQGNFYIAEEGLFCFLNMLYTLHQNVARIDEVRIY